MRRPLPLRFLTAASVAGLSLLAAPDAPGQIGPATAEQSDAAEPRFGMFRDPAGYEGSENTDPIDYNGELLEMKDGELTLSVWKGINANEALQVALDGEERRPRADGVEPGVTDRDSLTGRGTDASASPDAGTGRAPAGDRERTSSRVKVDENTPVYLNGKRATVSDLRPGDRVRVRGVDPDGAGVTRITALRTDDFIGVDADVDIAPDIDAPRGAGAVPIDPPTEAARRAARAAETGITTPGGGGFQDAPDIDAPLDGGGTGENTDRGVHVGDGGGLGDGALPGGDPSGDAPAEADQMKKAPGFGMAVADSPGEGVLVADVQPGGPAAEAGVRQGDFLTKLNGKSVQTPADVKAAAQQAMKADSPAPIPGTLWRDGEDRQVEITPSERARDHYEPSAGRAMSMSDRTGVSPKLGARVRDSEQSGVEVLAGAAVGALAAEAGSEAGGVGNVRRNPAIYGAPAGGFYGADLLDGVSPFDPSVAGYGGYGGYGGAVAAPDPTAQRLRIAAARRAMRERAAAEAIGLNAEDYYPGQRPQSAQPVDPPEGSDEPETQNLRPNDRIVGVEGEPIDDRRDLARALRGFNGDTLTLNVVRDGERVNLELPRRAARDVVE